MLAKIGSHSHGTYIPPTDPQAIDDIDYMGVVIPPMSFTLGLREWEGLNFQFEELDCVFYSFRKFISLLVKSNPNVLGLLWMKEDFYIHSHPQWNVLLHHRNLFSSKEAYPSFMGYAHGQMKKMTSFDLKTQKEWELSLALVEAAGWSKEKVIKGEQLPMPDQNAVLKAYLKYCKENDIQIITGPGELALYELNKSLTRIKSIHARHFQGYMGEKRKKLVTKYGFDTKNAAHLIRLMRMCVEFLKTGQLKVYRDIDGDYIRSIKSGKVSLEDVQFEADSLFAEAEILKDSPLCPLPDAPDVAMIDHLTVHAYLSVYGLVFDR